MFRRQHGTAKRFDPNALTLTQLQTLKERLLAALSEFLTSNNPSDFRDDALNKINAIQEEVNAIAVKLAIR